MSLDERISRRSDRLGIDDTGLADARSAPGPGSNSSSRSTPSIWAMAIALVASGIVSILAVDMSRVGFAATAAAALAGIASTVMPARNRNTAVLIGTGCGLAAGVGSWITTGTESAVGLACAAIVVWIAAGWSSIATSAGVATMRRRRELLSGAAVASTLIPLVGLATGAFQREAAILAVAIPVALAAFWAAGGDAADGGPTRSRWASPVVGGTAGIIGATCAMASLPSDVSSTLLIGAVVVSGAVAIATRRPLPPPARRTATVSLVLVAVICGIGAGPVTIVALGTALLASGGLANERGRVATPVPFRTTSTRIVAGLTVGGLLLRAFTHRGLWLDETTSVFQARMPFFEMIRFIGRTDNHPPLHYIVLWADIRLVGDSEFALRFPMMLMGAALIPMAFLIGREFFDRRVGVFAAAFTTFAPVAVWYGQEARMYSQFMLLAAISVYALGRILHGGGRVHWVVFTLSSVALVYTQYFAVLHVAATVVVLAVEILRRRRRDDGASLLKGGLASIAAQVALLGPLIPYALDQAVRNQEEGFGFSTSGIAVGSAVVPPPGIYGFLTNLQWVFFGYLPDDVSIRLVALWPVGLLIGLLLLGTQRRTANRILLAIAGIPMVVIFSVSFVAAQSRSLAEVRYFAGAVPILLVLLAAGVASIVRTDRLQYAAVGSLLALMSVALVVQQFDQDNPRRYEYQQAVEQIRRVAEPGDTVLYAPQYFNYTLDYYDPAIPSAPLRDGLPDDDQNSVFIVEAASFADSSQATDQVTAAIQDLTARGMTVLDTYQFAQITVWKIGPST